MEALQQYIDYAKEVNQAIEEKVLCQRRLVRR